jgi:ArsR family transcriptional regulator
MNSEVIKAIADETRLKLLNEIMHGEVCACELPSRVGISQPAVSQHLKVLLRAKLASMRKLGAKRLYSASQKGRHVLADISRW